MSILVAGVSSATQYVKSLNSFYGIQLREDDERIIEFGKTGLAARALIASKFLKSKHNELFMCDLDMLFPSHILEQFREHDLDIVTAHYYKREANPMQSIIRVDRAGWPYEPLIDPPRDGLHEVGTTGFGAVLIKREPFEAVNDYLPVGGEPFDVGVIPEMVEDHGAFGADVRFFFYARMLGYKLWLDASIECPHGHVSWLNHELYDKLNHREEQLDYWGWLTSIRKGLHGMDKDAARLRLEQLEMALNKVKGEMAQAQNQVVTLERQRAVLNGQIAEREFDLGEGPVIGKATKLPVFESKEELDAALENRGKGPLGMEENEAVEKRVENYKEIDETFVESIQDDPR